MSNPLFQRAPNAVEMAVDNTVIVVDPKTSQMITLNAVAGLIWAALETPVDMDRLVAICADAYPAVDRRQIRLDATAFIKTATDLGVVFSPQDPA